MSEDLLSPKEAAVYVGVSLPTLRRATKRNNTPKVIFPKNAQKIFYRRIDLDALIQPHDQAA